jgi:hypothetical protein
VLCDLRRLSNQGPKSRSPQRGAESDTRSWKPWVRTAKQTRDTEGRKSLRRWDPFTTACTRFIVRRFLLRAAARMGRPALLHDLHDVVANGVPHEVSHGMKIQLPHYIRAMCLRRFHT